MQRSKHYSVSRKVLREKPESVKFMLIVTDPPNVSTHEISKVSREFTEITPLSYSARAPLELVPRPGWLEHLTSNPTKPPVLPTLRRENKTLVVEIDESKKEVVVENDHDDRATVDVIDENQSNDASSAKVEVNDENESKETSNIDEMEPATHLDRESLDETQPVVQPKAPPENSISRAVRLELERIRFEKEAKYRCRRARALSPHKRTLLP